MDKVFPHRLNTGRRRRIISSLIQHLFADPDTLFIGGEHPDLEISGISVDGDQSRIGGFTQQQASYVIKRLRNPDVIPLVSTLQKSHETIFRLKLIECAQKAGVGIADSTVAHKMVRAYRECWTKAPRRGRWMKS